MENNLNEPKSLVDIQYPIVLVIKKNGMLVKEVTNDYLKFSSTNIEHIAEYLSKLPGVIYYFSTIEKELLNDVALLKFELKNVTAEKYLHYTRALQPSSGKAPSIKLLESTVIADNDVKRINIELIKKDYDLKGVKNFVEALLKALDASLEVSRKERKNAQLNLNVTG